MYPFRTSWLGVLLAMALILGACGGDESSDPTSASDTSTTTAQGATTTATEPADDGFPVTIDAPNGAVTIDRRPERIVSISPTSTEVLFAIGAGDQVVAVDNLSNHPEDAPVTDLSAFTPSIEAIAAYDPDLVFISYDPTGDVIPGLDALGIPVIVQPTALNVSDAYAQWEQAGAATGHVADAASLVADTQTDLETLYSSLPVTAADLSYYYEIDDTFYSATSSSFIGELLAPTTLRNIADTQDADGLGYPQLTSEYIVGADPDVIILADTICCGQSADTVAERPGWDTMTAVVKGRIVELDDDVASRWGPRITELVEDLVDAVVANESVGT